MVKVNTFDIERLAKISDNLDEEDAENKPGKVIRYALKSQISHLEDERFDETKENVEKMSESEEIREERARLSKEVFGNDREFKSKDESNNSEESTDMDGFDQHSATGSTKKIRNNEEKSKELSDSEIRAERDRLKREIFQMED